MRSNAYGRTASTTPRTARSGRGSRLGALRTKVTRSSPGVTKMVSPLSSAPAPPAPSAQCTTALPGKWPPHWTRVTPGRTASDPDQVRGDRPQPPGLPDRPDGQVVQVAGRVPEQVPLGRADQQGPLADGHRRVDPD